MKYTHMHEAFFRAAMSVGLTSAGADVSAVMQVYLMGGEL